MDSKEVLQQYIVGAMKSQSAIAELEKNLVDTSDSLKMQEAARSRYVIGFIRRVVQFKREEASAKASKKHPPERMLHVTILESHRKGHS